MTVFGLTKARHAWSIISQAKTAICEGTPLIGQADVVVDAVVDFVVDAVVDLVVDFVVDFVVLGVVLGALGVVLGAAGVVDIFGVVLGAAGVVEGAAGVVESCRFFLAALVQAAVTVVDAGVPRVTVEVTSVMGTKLEQNAEALSAIRIASQLLTSFRA